MDGNKILEMLRSPDREMRVLATTSVLASYGEVINEGDFTTSVSDTKGYYLIGEFTIIQSRRGFRTMLRETETVKYSPNVRARLEYVRVIVPYNEVNDDIDDYSPMENKRNEDLLR